MILSNGGPLLEDENTPRLRFIRVHINDWVASTRGMSLDEEGFYWRFTIVLYDRMGDIKDDDTINARAMGLDIRIYKKMKKRMLDLGKIYIAHGRITNSRVEREILKFVNDHKRKSDAATAREDAKRNKVENALEAPIDKKIQGDFGRTSAGLPPTSSAEVLKKSRELPPQLSPHLSEELNENNECNSTAVPQQGHTPHARTRPKPKPKPVSKVSNPHSPLAGGDHPLSQAFEDFWSAFPGSPPPHGRKTDKPKAFKVFHQIVTGTHREGLRAKAEDILRGAVMYASSQPDPQYIPMPTTWLNGARWFDQVGVANTDPDPVDGRRWGWWRTDIDKLRDLPASYWRSYLDEVRPNDSWPWWKLGPPPGNAECYVHPDVIAERGLAEKYGKPDGTHLTPDFPKGAP